MWVIVSELIHSMAEHRNPWMFFARNLRLTYIIVVGTVLLGIASIVQMPKESTPEVDIPVILVTTVLPGASAIDVEELVTNEIESSVQNLEDIDVMQSQSSQGLSVVSVTFDIDAVGREKLTDVRDRVERVKGDLPDDVIDPTVQQVSFSDRPILNLALSGPYPDAQLAEYAEVIQRSLESIRDVSEVTITGAPQEEVQVVVDQARALQFGISLSDITNTIASANIDVPIGAIVTEGELFTIRLDGRLDSVATIQSLPISARAGQVVRLETIADVRLGFATRGTINRLSIDGELSQPSLTLQLYKSPGRGDILTIIDTAREYIDGELQDLPSDLVVTYIENDADLIRTDLSNLVTSGSFTMVIVFVLLYVFLGLREAIIASVAVPMTFLMTFIVLNQLGYTVNFLTLFSLILALGILVDGAIVVVEGIYSNVQKGMDGRDAARATVVEFQQPLVAGTLTTIFVFLPLLLTSGVIGKFIRSIPVTISIVLVSSIIVALGFITAFASLLFKAGYTQQRGVWVERMVSRAYQWYEGALRTLVSSRRFAWRLLIGAFFAFVVSLSLPVVGVVAVNMFPAEDADVIYLDIEAPVGTPIDQTDLMARVVEDVLYNDQRLESFSVTVGGAANTGSDVVVAQRSHLASMVINVRKDRSQPSTEIITELEEMLQGSIGAEITVKQLDSGPPAGSPVQVNVIGDSFVESERVAHQMAALLAEVPGARNVSNGIDETNGEFVIRVDRQRAAQYGASVGQVAQIVRASIVGSDAATLTTEGDDVDIVVTSSLPSGSISGYGADVLRISSIDAIQVPTNLGMVPLSTLASIEYESSRTSISHEDGKRILRVTAGLEEGATTAAILAELTEKRASLPPSEEVTITYGGEAEDINQSFADLGLAMILGIIMIFGLLVWQFNSYRQALFILVTIPLALIGVFGGLALTNQPLSFPGFIGVVALAGIVVNNAIILIDTINNRRKSGCGVTVAVIESAVSRLQPILLTTITTVAGMVPLAFSSPTWAPLAYSIMFGLLFSTALTLFVVPTLYVLFVPEARE